MYHLFHKLGFLNRKIEFISHSQFNQHQLISNSIFTCLTHQIPASIFHPYPQKLRFFSSFRQLQNKERVRTVSIDVLVRSIVSIVQKTEQWDSLLTSLCDVSSSQITPPIAVQVMKRIKKPDLAFKFFNWLGCREGFKHDGLTYSAILKVLTKDANSIHASIADDLLRKKIELGFDIMPMDFEFVLQKWVKIRKPEKGFGLLDEMRRYGFVPSCVLCNVLLNGLFKCKQKDLGWKLFYLMQDGWIDVLDTETFNIVMKVACVNGRMEEALEFFNTMKQRDCMPDLDSYNILIKGFSEKGNTEKVCGLFKLMLDMKVRPDSYTMNLLIKELCKQGRPECGNDLFNYMRKVGWLDRKFVYTQLVDSLCNYGWWLKGLKIFVKMVRRGHHPSSSLYTNLVRRLCMGGRVREAFKLKNLIVKKGFMPDSENYSSLMEGVCLAGSMDMAEKLLREFRNEGLDLDLRMLNMLLHGYCKLGDVPKTLELLEKIKEKGWVPELGHCDNLIANLMVEGKVGEATLVKNWIQNYKIMNGSGDGSMVNGVNKLEDVGCLQK